MHRNSCNLTKTPKTKQNKKLHQSRPNGCTNAAATGASSCEVADIYLPLGLESISVAKSVPEARKRNNLNDAGKRGVINELLKESNKEGVRRMATSAESKICSEAF